ncbi:MAG: KTSC domain-containing protein [Chloroflexi bacterium]|nr:KTSC domain-containing protein [Chloroflexota bacterium]
MVDMIYVDSSNIEKIRYDSDAQELYVQFLSGAIYVYYGVPEHVYEEIMGAPSKGSYLNRVIKGVYEYAKL